MKTKRAIQIMLIGCLGMVALLWMLYQQTPSQQSGRNEITRPLPQAPTKSAPGKASESQRSTQRGKPDSLGPPSTRVALIIDWQADYLKRLEAVRSLNADLTSAEVEALYQFLSQKEKHDRTQAGHVLKNGLLNALCAIDPPLPGLTELMIQIYRDRDQNIVIRDYALQHLISHYKCLGNPSVRKASSLTVESIRTEQETMRPVLWEALAEVDSSIAGTALLGLHRLGINHLEFDRAKVAAIAVKLAHEQNASELTRVAALQVCGLMELADARPLLLQILQGEQNAALKLAAIGSLGMIGGVAEQPVLERILASKDERFRPAAELALKRIKARQTVPQSAASNNL
jgi:hypothetical protein